MHAIKGAWAGRTYALANSNDSGGRKSRVRRSKEERKELVVSFIQRHQKLNNGSFPSLNLTHKEVGGSFYIVREIVREVIQENRVLAPPKLLPGEQNMESFLEQYPLGSISVDPQIDVVSSNESQVLVNHHQYTNKVRVLDSRPIIELDQATLDNGTNGNESAYADAESKSKGPINMDLLLEQGAEADEGGVQELDVDLVTASNIVEDVQEKTSSQEEHNMENFISVDHQIDVESLDKSENGVSYLKSTNEEQVLDASQVSESDQGSYGNGTIVKGSSNAGKASSSTEERDVENLMEQSPTIISSIGSQIDVELVDGSEIGVSYHKAQNEEQVLDSTDILLSDQWSLVNGTIMNGSSKEVAESEESKELIDGKSQPERGVDGDKDEVKELEVYQTTSQTAESLVVETFPLRPVPQMDYDSDEELYKSVVSDGTLKKQDTEGLQVEAVNSSVPEKALLTKESIARNVNGSADRDAKDTLPTVNNAKVGANGILQQATSDKAAPNKQQFDIADVGSSKTKGSNPTLDRPKLESWEATTEKSAGKEADNPLMAFIKAFVNAFVKFWSE